jgi:outer membrane immunogenic protein
MQPIRTRLLVLGALVALPAAAHAGGLWNGPYVGLNLGYGWGKAASDFSVAGVPLVSSSEKLTGFVGGAQAGYNWRFGPVVAGIELDGQVTNQKAAASQTCAALSCAVASITQSSKDELSWFATLRPRLGFTIGPVWVYGTGGIGYGEFKDTQVLTTTLGSVTTTTIKARTALVYGGGVEAPIEGNLTAKLEYLYLDSGNVNTTYSLAGVGAIAEKSRLTESLVRAGLNYRF